MRIIQGTVLGPLFYVIYTNDIVTSIKYLENTSITYDADDTVILVEGKNMELVKNISIQALKISKTWLDDKEIFINISKTKIINFALKNDTHDFHELTLYADKCNRYCNCLRILKEHNIKYLGVCIDAYM